MAQTFTTVTEIARTYWPIGAAAFAGSLLMAPVCRRVALRWNIVDRPDDWLKPHKHPVPYLGGLAILSGWTIALMLAMWLFRGSPPPDGGLHPRLEPLGWIGIIIAGIAATTLGLIDDLRSLRPRTKLAGLIGVAVILLIFGLRGKGFVFEQAQGIRQPLSWYAMTIAIFITIFVVAGACNAVNLIDGLDGLCSGVMVITGAGFLTLAVYLHLFGDAKPLDASRVTLALAVMGASLGFLPYNRAPARQFMGDAGSMLLGLNAAVLLLLFAESRGPRWYLAALMIFGLPLSDMLLTLARRWRAGRPLMAGDRSHYYDQLVDRGWPVRKVVRTSYWLAIGFAALGCSAIVLRLRYMLPLYLLVAIVLLVLVWRLGMLRADNRDTTVLNPGKPLTQADRGD